MRMLPPFAKDDLTPNRLLLKLNHISQHHFVHLVHRFKNLINIAIELLFSPPASIYA
ncbi:hypothetical protein IX335_001166 [Porphyromonas levii]|nr:hypothetical protein [Porphyromonas levii]MBR8803406.1 hypothetical protein [Porphyromonas levii]